MLFTLSEKKVMFAFSSRALFDMEADNAVYDRQGAAAYEKYQRSRIKKPLKPGVAFAFAQKLCALNDGRSHEERLLEVVVTSRSDPYTGMRIFNSLAHYGLREICAGANAGGSDPVRYLKAFGANLFMTANEADARLALASGIPAALVYPRRGHFADPQDRELRIGYDFDGVLGSDESERVTHHEGLDAYLAHEDRHRGLLMPPGPFKPVALAFNQLRLAGADIRTGIITARVAPHNARPVHSTDKWGIIIDESVFTGSAPKAPFVEAFGADAFFDDTPKHAHNVAQNALGTMLGHVVCGVKNEQPQPA